MRRAHPRWGTRRIAFELATAGVASPPSRTTVHRVLVRNGLVCRQEQQHLRKYGRWQREAPMHLWQLDLVGGIYLADGRECKMLTGIDDHSRFVVVAAVMAVPSRRAVADAFLEAMRVYGVPSEVLTDTGKQFTGRFTKPRPAELIFKRVCRENGITTRLTKPYSPTTTGKIERWHHTPGRELLEASGPFGPADRPSGDQCVGAHLQPSINGPTSPWTWPPQPARSGRTPPPNSSPSPHRCHRYPRSPHTPSRPSPWRLSRYVVCCRAPRSVRSSYTVIAASGLLAVIASVHRVSPGADRAGQRAYVWVDEYTVHVLIDGQLVKTVASNLDAEDPHHLTMRGARPAGPPPAGGGGGFVGVGVGGRARRAGERDDDHRCG